MVPIHIGIIPDGNRRFGVKYGMPLHEAYERGVSKVQDVLKWSNEIGIRILTIWGFSTENFKRSDMEKKIFFGILEKKLNKLLHSEEFSKQNVKIKVIGKRESLPPNIEKLVQKAEKMTSENDGLILNFALGYGGRQEIIDACNKALRSGKRQICEKEFSELLYTSDIPDPDLIIRTSGETRLSGFLPWQCVYSELVFLKPLWPEMRKKDFMSAIRQFETKQRRFGK